MASSLTGEYDKGRTYYYTCIDILGPLKSEILSICDEADCIDLEDAISQVEEIDASQLPQILTDALFHTCNSAGSNMDHLHVVHVLKHHGADVNSKNAKGETPTDILSARLKESKSGSDESKVSLFTVMLQALKR